MNSEKRQQSVSPETRPSTFSVWTDEGGNPQFPTGKQAAISSECFVWIDSSKSPEVGQWVLLSTQNRMTFDRIIHGKRGLSLEKNPLWSLSDPEMIVLGVVIAGLEWIGIAAED
ncbi:MAG: hypothetical protein ACYCT9_03310 [Leptospirillum sp.]|jgi:hypothetical protein